MTKLAAAAVALMLAGCASAPRPQVNIISHHPSTVKTQPAPVVTIEPVKPATFKERWQEFRKKHPVRWTH